MANRIVLLVSVILGGIALAATPGRAEPAAEECLAKPKGPPPSGQHWFYQTNRETKRKCWFLGNAGAKAAAAKPPKAVVLPPEKPEELVAAADPGQKPGKQAQAANAHAELIVDPQREQPVTAAVQTEPDAQPQTDVWPPLDTLPTPPAAADQEAWTVASRWPESSGTFTAEQRPAVGPAPASQVETPAPPVLTAQSLVPLDQPPAAANSSSNRSLAQFTAGLIFLVIGGGALFMFFAPGRRRDMRDIMYRDDLSSARFERRSR